MTAFSQYISLLKQSIYGQIGLSNSNTDFELKTSTNDEKDVQNLIKSLTLEQFIMK